MILSGKRYSWIGEKANEIRCFLSFWKKKFKKRMFFSFLLTALCGRMDLKCLFLGGVTLFAYAFTFLVALAVTFVLTPVVKNFAIRIGAVDKPDARKVHHGLVPRLGGLAIYAGFMVSAITTIGFTYEMVGIMAGATFLIIVGVADDVVSLRPKVKLLGQIIAAAIPVVIFNINIDWINVPWHGIVYLPAVIFIPLTIFWIIGFINTVNLIDGLDGLAAGIATIASIAIALLAFQMGQWTAAAAMVAMTGACLAFLQYNFNPAKIFMGDTGSMFLGYIIAAVSVMGSIKTAAAAVLIVPLVALAVPITDTLLAIVRRKSSGVPIFSPDKNHLHHRLLAKGLNQKQVVLIMYALTAFFSCIALVVIHLSLWAGIAIVAAALILFILWARKLGVMKEIVPSPYQMRMKKEKEEKGKESKSKGPEEKPALK